MMQQKSIQKFIHKISGQPASYSRKSRYSLGKTLGAGTFGVVLHAKDLETGEHVAMKIILKKTLKNNFQMVYDELDMLQNVHHKNIVGFRDWFESRDKFYIVTQLATGGELFDRIVSKGHFTEFDAASCMKQILEALEYLHNNNIVHRDIKPENVLYLRSEEEDPNSPIVLADFGIAKKLISENQELKSTAGSFGYAAPEVFQGTGHGKPCDIWSAGVIAYTLLSGYSPFRAENVNDFLQEVRNDNGVIFHARRWKDISLEAREFIMHMLRVDPQQRRTASELLKDPWITNNNKEVDLLPGIREGFNARQKLIQLVEVVRLENRVRALREFALANKDFEGSDSDSFDELDFRSSDTFSNFVTAPPLPPRPGSAASSVPQTLNPNDPSPSSSSLEAPRPLPQKSPSKSDLTLKAFQSLVLTAQKNKERVESFEDSS